ncbi:MAG: electron transfer flavoprotein subunit alpha/FixB family protein [Acidobacteriota bacterium]
MKTLIFIEKNPLSGLLRDVSVELSAKAFQLMEPYNGEVVGIFTGDKLPENTDILFSYGMDRLIHYNNSSLSNFYSVAYKNILEKMILKEDPDFVLFGATNMGREVAPLISSSLQTGLTADCTQLYIDDFKNNGKILYQVRPAFGGNILATIVSPDQRPAMSTVREGVMRLPEKQNKKKEKIESFDIVPEDLWFKDEFLEILKKEKKVNLNKSNIIIAGGAGVGSKENFKLLFDLAEALGAEVGGSRAAVDSGFIDKSRQIGQTGAVVRPKLYISFGISGSIQHRAGMEESGKIIAVNTDVNAPIFDISHFGIVEDMKVVIPVMIRYLKEDING